jgi:RNA ligase (TIGR02306 family)
MKGLVYIGKIIDLQPIEGADFILSATVVCGEGGKWKGIIRRADFALGCLCIVFLPDSQLDPEIHHYLPFMKDSNWRVKMRRFKGAPSEVLITKLDDLSYFPITDQIMKVGVDVTELLRVTKYSKPIPPHLQGLMKGDFPSFIPKTDELNYQMHSDLVDSLVGKPYYITEKADGSSTTAYRYKGEFGICSRNLELQRDDQNGYWVVANKYRLEESLPEGIAIQWETCGPGIQSNPMGLKEIDGFAFSAYNIQEHRYLNFVEFNQLCHFLQFPQVKLICVREEFSKDGLEVLGEGKYSNGNEREGVVVRSIRNHEEGKPISFKVINLNYEK